jgi:DnaJ like chaperone protein
MTIWQRLSDAASAAVSRQEKLISLVRDLGRSMGIGARDPENDIAFTIAIIALSAKMAKSDGAVTIDEVAAFKRLVQVPPDEEAHVRRVFDLAKQDVAGYESYARQIGALLEDRPELKRDVLEALFIIAVADGVLHEKEDIYLRATAEQLGVPESELAYTRSLFVHDSANPYRIMGLTPSATDSELIAHRRALVLEHHPDKLAGRGVPAEFVAVAERKLAAINAAFDAIAKERGL